MSKYPDELVLSIFRMWRLTGEWDQAKIKASAWTTHENTEAADRAFRAYEESIWEVERQLGLGYDESCRFSEIVAAEFRVRDATPGQL